MSQTDMPTTTRLPRSWVATIFLLFFLSGTTSLIYEVIWARNFALVFGVTTYAVSTVLAAFFTGLAIGSYAAGRIIDRTRRHPLLIYGGMEAAIGIYALLLPVFLKFVEASYPAVYSSIGESFSLFTLYRFVVSFALLALPTTLMGATLPVLSKLLVEREDALGIGVGRLYAVNTFGAVTGTFTAGFLLIPTVGISTTTLAAAGGNFVLAIAALCLSFSDRPSERVRPTGGVSTTSAPLPLGGSGRFILALAFTSGLAIIGLEVVWTRSLVLVLGSTTYAFTTMLTAVLVGIALGSAVFARLADTTPNRGAWVAALLFFGGLFAVFGPAVINRLPFIFLSLYDYAYGLWPLIIATQFVVCFLLVFIPTFVSGGSFPILIRMYSRGEDRIGRTVADVYAVNTLGGIIGSLLCGFVLIKYFGLQPSLTILALFLMLVGGGLAIAIAAPWSRWRRGTLFAALIAIVAVLSVRHPQFDTKLLFAGWGPFAGGYYASRMIGSTVDITDRHMQRLLYHREGVSASVDVLQDAWGDEIISINAKPVATTYLYDMRTLRMLGHLPMLLHPEPKDVLLIGLGSGVSSGICAIYPSVETVTTVELSTDVPGGTACFAERNHNVLENPKFHLVINDGANYVKATRKQYDVISADPIHPFVTGAGTLYSREHWQAAKECLRDGGILAQWLPLYHLSPSDFATILGTFVDVFPNATIWFCGIDTVLIGAKDDLEVDLERTGVHMSDPRVMTELLEMGVHEPADVLGWYIAGPDQMRAIGMDATRNTLDFPIIEFSAPKAVTLRGISATMPALLGAVEQLSPADVRRQLNEISIRPLKSQPLATAAAARLAGRWLMRSQLLSAYDYADRSLEAAVQAYSLRPHDTFLQRAVADAQCLVADARFADGYYGEALEYYRESYANDPRSLISLTSGVRAALNLGHLSTAEELLSIASEDQRQAFQHLIYQGVLALRHRRYASARAAFLKAADLGQESPTLHVGLGLLDLQERKRDSATAHFARAFDISTATLDTLYDIVDVGASHGFASEVRPYTRALVDIASSAIAADPGDPYLYGVRALAYSTLGQNALAERDQATKRSLTDWWPADPILYPEEIPPSQSEEP